MKIVVESELLAEALADAAKAISSKPAMPVLAGLLLKTTDEGVSITGADERITIESFILDDHVQIIRSGAVVLPKIAIELINKMSGEIEIDVGGKFQTTILHKSEEIEVGGSDPEEFPHPPSVNWNETSSVNGKDLKEFIKKTVFSVATNDKMPILTGVNISFSGERVKFIATNRNRMALIARDIQTNESGSAVVDGRGLVELEKILFDKDEVQFGFSKSFSGEAITVYARTDRFAFYSRVLQGEYPDVEAIMDKFAPQTTFIVSKKEFSKKLDLIYTLAKEEKMSLVKLKGSEKEITLHGKGKESGKASGIINPTSFEGENFLVSLNAKYIIDAIKAIDSDSLTIIYTGKMSPVFLYGGDAEGSKYIVQPYRTEV